MNHSDYMQRYYLEPNYMNHDLYLINKIRMHYKCTICNVEIYKGDIYVHYLGKMGEILLCEEQQIKNLLE